MKQKNNLKKNIGRRKRTIFKITTPIISIVLLTTAILSNLTEIKSTTAEYNYDLMKITSEVNSKISQRSFIPVSELSPEIKTQMRSYCQYLIDQSRFKGTVSLCEELYLPYIIYKDNSCYFPFWTIKDGILIEFYTNLYSPNKIIEDYDIFVELSWLNTLARIAHVGREWEANGYQNYHVTLMNQYVENYYWAKNRANADLNFGHAWTCWELASTLTEIYLTGDLSGLTEFGGLASGGISSVATSLNLLSNLKTIKDTTDVTMNYVAMTSGEEEFYQQWNSQMNTKFSEVYEQVGGDFTLGFATDISELYRAWLIYRDLAAAFGQDWVKQSLSSTLKNPGFLSQQVIEAHDTLEATNIAKTIVNTLLGPLSVDNAAQAKTCYMDSIDLGYVANYDWKLAYEYIPDIMTGTITPGELVEYYQTLDIRSMVLSGYYKRNAEAAHDQTWGTVFNIEYPKITVLVNEVAKLFHGNSIEDAIANLNDLSTAELNHAISISQILCPSNQYQMYNLYYKTGNRYGILQVNPTTFSFSILPGKSMIQELDLSALGGDVTGIEVTRTTGPDWISIDKRQITSVSSGSKDQVILTLAPPKGTSQNTYSFEIQITCAQGTPSKTTVSGTATVQPDAGSLIVSPSVWTLSIPHGKDIQQTFTITAKDTILKNVQVIKKDNLAWISLSPTTIGDIPCGQQRQFTISGFSYLDIKSGEYPYSIDITYVSDTQHTEQISGTITIKDGGEYTVTPSSWCPTVGRGSTMSYTFTVSALGPVQGVAVLNDDVPNFAKITPTILGDFTAGQQKTFTVTLAPSINAQVKTYPFSLMVNCVSGKPSFIKIQGTINVVQQDGDDLYESNEGYETAKEITAGSYPNLKSFNEDWFKLTLSKGDHATVTITFNNNENDLDLYLESQQGSQAEVDRSDSNDQNTEQVEATISLTGIYYAYIIGADHTYKGSSYDLVVAIDKPGTLLAEPTTWNPTLTPGNISKKMVSITAQNGPVQGIIITKLNGASWITISPSSLSNLVKGQSAQVEITATPSLNIQPGNYPFTFKITSSSGGTTDPQISGTITILDTNPGSLSIDPEEWSLTLNTGTNITKTFQITAHDKQMQNVMVTKTNGPTWLTISPSTIGSLAAGQTADCQVTLTPSKYMTPGIYPCLLTVSSGSSVYTELSVTVTITWLPNDDISEFSEDFETGYDGWQETTGMFQNAGTQTLIQHEGLSAFIMTSTREADSGYAGQYSYPVNIPVTPEKQFTFSYYFPSKDVSYVGYLVDFNNGKEAYYISLFSGWFVNNPSYYLYQYYDEQINTWNTHTVNIYEDYLNVYGDVPLNLEITSISILMGDPYFTDQTQTAYFDSITIS
jgi:uncharacterized membrane protein